RRHTGPAHAARAHARPCRVGKPPLPPPGPRNPWPQSSPESQQDQLVAVDHRRARGIAEQCGLLLAAAALYPVNLGGVVFGQALRECLAVVIADTDRIAAGEIAFHRADPACQQAFAHEQCTGATRVDHQRALEPLAPTKPRLACSVAASWKEERSQIMTECPGQRGEVRAVDYRQRNS